MFHGALDIDLPSEPYPRSGRVASLLRWVLLGPDPRRGRGRITEQGVIVLDHLMGGLGAAGFDDVIHILVDRKPAYVDTNEQLGDLHEALEKALASGALRDGLKDVSLALCRRQDDLHTLVAATINEEVLVGDEEVHIRLSSRLSALRIVRDEGPLQYRARVRSFLAQGRFEQALRTARAHSDRLQEHLREALRSSVISAQPVVARIVQPGPTQLGRLRHLGFGSRLRPPTYRAAPPDRRVGAYDDPHVYHYFDPYHDLLGWILVEAIAEGQWDAPDVLVVDPDGRPVTPSLEVLREQLTLEDDRVSVSDDIPHLGLDPAEAGSPHAPGWGGEDFGQ